MEEKSSSLALLMRFFYPPENRHVDELIGLSNIFDDARVVGYDEVSGSTVLISEDLKIRVNSLKLNPGDQVPGASIQRI